ncbi:MAG: hypothetical protein SCJ97_09115 [Bacillota bacterium]|nr:hypothetical protein [Bacillota bacterium]
MLRTKCFISILLAFLLFLTSAAPVFASYGTISYQKSYDLDGIILIKILSGDEYSGAGFHKTLVKGVGNLQRVEAGTVGDGTLAVSSESSWIADPDSLRGLEVASTFGLNPESEYLDSNYPQVFAVSVKADRGESGQLTQNISAESGESNSLAIYQHAETSDGTVKRYIDLAFLDPDARIFEDTKIVGYASIVDQLNTGIEEEVIFVVNQDEGFVITVFPGTVFEEVEFPEIIDLVFDEFILTGIPIEWSDESDPVYNPDEPGRYLFIGQLLLPENVIFEGKVFTIFTVNIEEPAETENIDLNSFLFPDESIDTED